MGQQLVVMGIRSNPKLDPSSNVVRVLIDMYVDIGDHIALQYGGSEAHKKVSTERSESIVGPTGKVSPAAQQKGSIRTYARASNQNTFNEPSIKNCLRPLEDTTVMPLQIS